MQGYRRHELPPVRMLGCWQPAAILFSLTLVLFPLLLFQKRAHWSVFYSDPKIPHDLTSHLVLIHFVLLIELDEFLCLAVGEGVVPILHRAGTQHRCGYLAASALVYFLPILFGLGFLLNSLLVILFAVVDSDPVLPFLQ